jgi:hypothetical protein
MIIADLLAIEFGRGLSSRLEKGERNFPASEGLGDPALRFQATFDDDPCFVVYFRKADLRRFATVAALVTQLGSTSAFGQGSLETGVHWSKDVRFDKIAEAFGCYGEYVDREEEIGPAIARAYDSGKVGVIHVAIDPKVNSEEMPSYDEFRTWYAEGTQ